ncbi:MAG: RecQ family ATP-dependent DNA helicase [Reichenbachiella sp.]
MSNPNEILKKYWGYDAFRPAQEDIILSVLEGKDTLALLPTGGGKSICFQVPGLILEGICVVISPLIALMTDQVDQLNKRGIKAVTLYSGMPHREIDLLLENCVLGKVQFLYVSPERIKSEIFIERIKRMKVGLLAIDEAHCISQWGYDFRPSYAEIENLYPFIGEAKKIALTATATKEVKVDICDKLGFENAAIFQKSFARKNLSYSVFELENKGSKLLEIIKRVGGSSIVYVRTRKEAENVSKFLYQNGISSDFYHGGIESKHRKTKQTDWINNKRQVMVATNAFGMGIDKPDVRTVIHLDLPESLEAYYQEAGRAGRDEKNAFGVLLYSTTDLHRLEQNELMRNPSLEYLQRIYQAIANYFKLATGSSEWQSYDFDIKAFCHQYNLHPMEAHYAVKKLQEMGLVILNDSLGKSSSLKFMIGNDEVYKFCISNVNYEPVIKAVLRLYGGSLYTDFQNIYEFEIARLCKSSQGDVVKKLQFLSDNEIVIYDQVKSKPQLTYLTPRLEVAALKKFHKQVEPRQKVTAEKVKSMRNYSQNTSICRTRILQEYFDEEVYLNCGFCDVCIKAKKDQRLIEALDETKQRIVSHLRINEADIDDLKEELEMTDDFLYTEAIRILLEEDKIRHEGMLLTLK